VDSAERVLIAMNHQESDRIPFELGDMAQSGIHCIGYANLRAYLSFQKSPNRILDINLQQAKFDKDIKERLLIGATMVYSKWASVELEDGVDEGEFWGYIDEWGVKRVISKEDGLYRDVLTHPLAVDHAVEKFERYRWPNLPGSTRFRGLHQEARQARQDGQFVVLMGLCPGIFEMYGLVVRH
jgi:uroporphyrinogen decarboxylase